MALVTNCSKESADGISAFLSQPATRSAASQRPFKQIAGASGGACFKLHGHGSWHRLGSVGTICPPFLSPRLAGFHHLRKEIQI